MYLNPETNQYEWKAANPYMDPSKEYTAEEIEKIRDILIDKYENKIKEYENQLDNLGKGTLFNTGVGQLINKTLETDAYKQQQDLQNKITEAQNKKQELIIQKAIDNTESAYLKALMKYGYDTGGYTGDWGPEGKLAFLHQKELVLNSSDTENILSAVSIIRDISNAIDRYASISRAIGLSLAPNIHTTESTIEQNVKIEATFPNVSNHSEIEEAFNNLVNEAAQYAYRKK